jgi:hypothetical protein
MGATHYTASDQPQSAQGTQRKAFFFKKELCALSALCG